MFPQPPTSTLFPYTTLFRSSDIEHWKMADLKRHFEMGYAPNNAVMVVAGDVNSADVLKLAGRYLEGIKPHAPRSEEHTSELQSRFDLVCRLLLEKKKKKKKK